MTEKEFESKSNKGQVNFLPPTPLPPIPEPPKPDEFEGLLGSLRRPRRHLDSPPTFVPKTFAEQIQFYDDGAEQRAYFFINGVWRYTTLT